MLSITRIIKKGALTITIKSTSTSSRPFGTKASTNEMVKVESIMYPLVAVDIQDITPGQLHKTPKPRIAMPNNEFPPPRSFEYGNWRQTDTRGLIRGVGCKENGRGVGCKENGHGAGDLRPESVAKSAAKSDIDKGGCDGCGGCQKDECKVKDKAEDVEDVKDENNKLKAADNKGLVNDGGMEAGWSCCSYPYTRLF